MKTIIVIGAGIVGVSTAIWLESGLKLLLLIKKDLQQVLHMETGILAASSIIPVPNPSLIKKLPFYLLSKDSPVFLKCPTYLKCFHF